MRSATNTGVGKTIMSANTDEMAALEDADSGIVRVPPNAISRPLAERGAGGLSSGFIDDQGLADLLFRKRIHRAGRGQLICDGQVYDLHEAVRVVRPEHNQSDPYGLSGVVERLDELLRAGASVGPATMYLGSATYQIVRGVIAVPRSASTSMAG
jgi:hypothetical protein